jgi:tetratricopeptide (TPR) repeat protein
MKKMKKIITISLLIICFSGHSQKKESHEKWIDSLVAINKKTDVEKLLKEQLKDKKRRDYTNRCLGYFYLQDEKFDLSEKYYRAELQSKPKCGICNFYLGRVYSKKKDYKNALIYLDKAIVLEPKNVELYAYRGSFKYVKGNDKTGARNDFNKAIEIEPKNASLYFTRGEFNTFENFLTLAMIDYNKSIELESNNYLAYLKRAEIFYNQQKIKEAIIDLNFAISLDSKQESLYTSRGSIFATIGEIAKANADFESSIEIKPDGYYAYYLRSKIKYQAEDMNGSCDDLTKSLNLINKFEPQSQFKSEIENSISSYCSDSKPSYYFQRGIARYNMNEFEKAIEIYSKGLEKFPNNSLSLSFRGNAYLEVKKYEKAIADYDLSNQNVENLIVDMRENSNYKSMDEVEFMKHVNGTIALNSLLSSESKFELQKYDDALLEIEKAIKSVPDLPKFGLEKYYNIRGAIYMALGENQKAIDDFGKCLQIKPSFSLALVNRALAKVNLKNREKFTARSVSLSSSNFNANWEFPVQSKTEYSRPNLLSALADCNQAVIEDSNFGYAFYIRGEIKKLLEQDDYCNDFKKAKKLDFQIDEYLLNTCK